MLKYTLAAMGLKAFSATERTREAYRELSNRVGEKGRMTRRMPGYYFNRVNRMLRLHRVHGFPKDGDRVLELGTGWLHWEALIARLFFDVKAVVYDVRDHRQLGALKSCVQQLDHMLEDVDALKDQKQRAHELIEQIVTTETFEELYDILDFEYVLDPKENLKSVGLGTYDAVLSAGVLEHVQEDKITDTVRDITDLIKPGGHSYHTVNMRDHLHLYDNSVSPKQYLAYSNATWKTLFENKVQYFNRVQRSDWLAVFGRSGLQLLEEEVEEIPTRNLRVGKSFRHYDLVDLSCGGLRVVHHKPGGERSGHHRMHLGSTYLVR